MIFVLKIFAKTEDLRALQKIANITSINFEKMNAETIVSLIAVAVI